jgi:hypothetical protein
MEIMSRSELIKLAFTLEGEETANKILKELKEFIRNKYDINLKVKK